MKYKCWLCGHDMKKIKKEIELGWGEKKFDKTIMVEGYQCDRCGEFIMNPETVDKIQEESIRLAGEEE